MKSVAIFLTLFTIAIAYDDLPHDAKYYETFMGDEKAMNNLLGCIMNKNPCDDFSTHVKSHMMESLTDGCNECDTTQKHYGHVLEEAFKNEKYKPLIDEMKAMYDPDGKLMKMFEDKIKGY